MGFGGLGVWVVQKDVLGGYVGEGLGSGWAMAGLSKA